MSDPSQASAPDLITALLEADAAERERLLQTADRRDLETVLSALGHRRESAAAEVLSLVDVAVDDRALKKAARRELHRLQSSGVQVPARPVRAIEPAWFGRSMSISMMLNSLGFPIGSGLGGQLVARSLPAALWFVCVASLLGALLSLLLLRPASQAPIRPVLTATGATPDP